MEDSVLVIAGEWECGDFGRWRFRVSREEMARFVGLSEETSYETLVNNVVEAFAIKENQKTSLSFLYETDTTVFTQGKMPPVSISSDVGLRQFIKSRNGKPELNMLLTLKSVDIGLGKSIVEFNDTNVYGDIHEEDNTVSDDLLVAHMEIVEAELRSKRVTEVESEPFREKWKSQNILVGAMDQEDKDLNIRNTVDKIGCSEVDNIVDSRQSAEMERGSDLGGSEEEDYDYDHWTDLINNDYPPNWDPFEEANVHRRKRKNVSESNSGVVVLRCGGQKKNTAEEGNVGYGGQELVVNTDGTVGNGGHLLTHLDQGGHENCINANEMTNAKRGEETIRSFSAIGFSLRLEESEDDGAPMTEEMDAVEKQCRELSPIRELPGPLVLRELSLIRELPGPLVLRELSPIRELGILVGEGSGTKEITTTFQYDDDVFVEDSLLYVDAPPVRDNMTGLPSDQANMDLRRGVDAIYVGKVFKDKSELRKTLSMYAIKRLFHFKMGKSDTKRAIANCVDPRCDWLVYATTHKDSTNVEIRKVCLKHSCDIGTRSKYGKNVSSQILADIMKAKFANGKKGPRACEIPDLVLSECNVTISYMKAWHAKELAISSARGTEEGSYQFLSTYFHLLKTSNPGTISRVHTTVDKDGATPFKYLFFALGGSIAGYKYLRKVIVIDGTQMKGKYKGCLVAASGQDGNTQIFPLGFGVIDGENEAGWEWFFRQLTAFVPDEEDLVFVSDRHAAIYAGLGKVYPSAHHGACAVHLIRNVKHRYKCAGLAKMVDNAARAFTVGDFRYWFDEVRKRRPACAKYLQDIGFEHWSLANFMGKRYNVMSSNISESLNNAMKKAVDYPIAIMVEFIRGMLMSWFCSRRNVAAKTTTRCTPEVEDQLIDHLQAATDCSVISASSWIFQVNDGTGCVFKVDLENRTCTCRVFDVLMIPCCHAIAAVGVNGVDIHSLVGKCYSVKEWANLYEHVILHVPKESDTDVPSAIKENGVKPPKTKRSSGRPKKKRIPSQGEQVGGKKFHKCSRCSGRGHNRTTCKNPI